MSYASFYEKVKRRIKAWLAPQTILVTLQDGKQFRLHNPPFPLETEIYWQGFEGYAWEQETRRLWVKLCPQAKVIFDIGANTGIFSLLAKVYQPEAKVYAFEPQPNVFRVLQQNNALNNFDIACQGLALSSLVGTLPFYNYGSDPFGKGNTTAGSLNKEWRPRRQKQIEVRVSTLDAFLVGEQLEAIDLMKIDVETLEAAVLQGYQKHLLLHQPIILLEVQTVQIGQEIAAWIEKLDYLYFNIDEKQGLIPTTRLGAGKFSNYLLCPQQKWARLQTILA